ncbi:hypothetical protein N665_0228s0011 [Sinapis alba]|nr:hypothetical protein N665_0228s0011 [Sinapis alba]
MGSCLADLATLPDKTRIHGEALDFVTKVQDIHQMASSHLTTSASKFKADADKKQRKLLFEPGDLVWVVLTKDRLPAGKYNKLKSHKIGPVEVLERVNPNADRVRLPPHHNTANVFNVKHLFPYRGDNDDPDSWSNPSHPGRPDAATHVIPTNPNSLTT